VLLSVKGEIYADSYLNDAMITISVIYEGVENLGGFSVLGKYAPNARRMILYMFLWRRKS